MPVRGAKKSPRSRAGPCVVLLTGRSRTPRSIAYSKRGGTGTHNMDTWKTRKHNERYEDYRAVAKERENTWSDYVFPGLRVTGYWCVAFLVVRSFFGKENVRSRSSAWARGNFGSRAAVRFHWVALVTPRFHVRRIALWCGRSSFSLLDPCCLGNETLFPVRIHT